MTKKKRYCISLDKVSDDILKDLSEYYRCSKSEIVCTALARLNYLYINKMAFLISKKVVDNK